MLEGKIMVRKDGKANSHVKTLKTIVTLISLSHTCNWLCKVETVTEMCNIEYFLYVHM